MKIIRNKRCLIGEGPIWNNKQKKLYFTNGLGNELCIYDIYKDKLQVRKLKANCAAFCFDKKDQLIVSRADGVFILNNDDTVTEIYNTKKYKIQNANDMKVGPDGRIYVGTQSEKRLGISNQTDGKLYSIDKNGNVTVLLDNLSLSNGLDWSSDEKYFYHTDSDTSIIKEYTFDKINGNIEFTGREIKCNGVDGFTVAKNGDIYVACWGWNVVSVIDTQKMQIKGTIKMPTPIVASCCFCGENMDILAVTTSSLGVDIEKEVNAGYTFLIRTDTCGKLPYIFGKGMYERQKVTCRFS